MTPANIDSSGKPGIIPPGLTLRGSVNICPEVVTVIDCVDVTPFLVRVTV